MRPVRTLLGIDLSLGATSSRPLDCILLFTLLSDLTVCSSVAGDVSVFMYAALCLFLPLVRVDRYGAAEGAGGVVGRLGCRPRV